MGSGGGAQWISLASVLITGLLTAFTALRTSKDRGERRASRRQIEEDTTDVILARTRRELDRVYRLVDAKSATIKEFERWIRTNSAAFTRCGITLPDLNIEETSILEFAREIRPALDEEGRQDIERRYRETMGER